MDKGKDKDPVGAAQQPQPEGAKEKKISKSCSWSWSTSKQEKARLEEAKILNFVKAKYTSKMIPCGKDKDGKPLEMNTLIFEPSTSDAKDDGAEPLPIVVAHGYGAGLGFFFRNFDAIASVPGTRVYAIDWLGMGRSTRCSFPQPPTEGKDAKGSAAADGTNREKDAKEAVQREYDGVQLSLEELEISDEDIQGVKSSEDFFLRSFDEWRKAVGIDKMILIGHSLGGYLSMVYALANSARIVRLLLLSPVGIPKAPKNFMENFENRVRQKWKLRTAIWLWDTSTPQQILRNMEWIGISKWLTSKVINRRFEHLQLEKDVVDAISGYLHSISVLPRSGENSLNKILKIGAWAKIPLELRIEKHLKVPVSFFYGEMDWMDKSPAEQFLSHSRLRELVSSVHVIPQGGHHLYLENPAAFNPVIVKEIQMGIDSLRKSAQPADETSL